MPCLASIVTIRRGIEGDGKVVPPRWMRTTESARLRQGSNATNLRHEKVVNDSKSVSGGKANGEKKRKSLHDAIDERDEATIKKSTEYEEGSLVEREQTRHASRSATNSGKAGQGSAAATPRTENFPTDVTGGSGPAMLRKRSTRGVRTGNQEHESSSEPATQGPERRGLHKRSSIG